MASAKDIFETFILEIRPRLQSVNAFVTLENKQESVEVVLEETSIRITTLNDEGVIPCEGISVVPNSLSSVKVTENHLSFRFATNNTQELGGFKTELLQNTVASMESLSNKPLLSKDTSYAIHCLTCGSRLADALQFDRVLPLPSENADTGDFFCHARQGELDLDPKEKDVFYSQCFVHLNAESIKNVRYSGKVVACRVCLQWLGIRPKPSTIRLWFNTVKFLAGKSCITTPSLQDVFDTVKNAFRYSIHSSLRLVLTCQTSSSSEDAILIWVLEKNLQVLFNGSGSLKRHEVAKILFKFVAGEEATLVEWRKDTSVSSFSVSKVMMVELLKELYRFNKMFPKEYSKSNDFKISYLMLHD